MQSYGPLVLSFSNRDDWNLSRILGIQSRNYGGKPFLIEPGKRSYSYAETDLMASRIATGLEAHGLKSGDRLLIYLNNCADYVLTWFGATRAGVVETPINTEYFGEILKHCVRVTTPRGIVVDASYADRFFDIGIAEMDFPVTFFVLGEGVEERIRSLRELGFAAEPFSALLSQEPRDDFTIAPRWELAAILFTSGTTGPSKAVMMSHAQCYLFSEECVNLTRLTAEDVYLTSNTLFHANAQFLTVYPALIAGATVALYERFSSSRFSERVAESQATVTNFLGVMMDWVGKQPPSASDVQSRLRCIFSVPTAWTMVDTVRRRFGVKEFVECFGQTEICLPMLTPYGMERPEGAVGLPVTEWFDIRLADPETDEEVKLGQVGELQIRPREPWTINSGYFAMPEATANSRRNLWFHTGDGLKQDANGWFYFVDRFKDCLRRRGENISSFEVEQPIMLHPDVAICAAVGLVASEDAGEDDVCVFVVPKEGRELSPRQVVDWSEGRMPKSFVPRYIQIFDKLPTTPSGKIQKAELRRIGAEGAWDRLNAC